MHGDRSDWFVLPLLSGIAVVMLVGVQGNASAEPSLLERLSNLVPAFHSEPEMAKVDDPYKVEHATRAIKLDGKLNKKLTDGTPSRPKNTLASLKTGEQTLAGVPFTITDGVIQLASVDRPEWPKSVEGIAVDGQCARLYLFHATQGGETGVKDGTTIGSYIVHYEDGSQETIPIVYGEDIRDWWNNDESKAVTRGKTAWIGTNGDATEFGMTLRLFVSRWENPKPAVAVKTIDYTSAVAGEAAPFCIAMTAEIAPASARAESKK